MCTTVSLGGMSESLPELPPLDLIRERLPLVFPEGIPHRNYYIREIAAKTLFVMFYVGALLGAGRYLRPDQVRRMTGRQAKKTSDKARAEWRELSLSRRFVESPEQWYAVNTRESIRDETLRDAFIRTGAVIARDDLATTSSLPRYTLEESFAALSIRHSREVHSKRP